MRLYVIKNEREDGSSREDRRKCRKGVVVIQKRAEEVKERREERGEGEWYGGINKKR